MKNFGACLIASILMLWATIIHVNASELENGLKAMEEKRFKQAIEHLNAAFASGEADAGFYLARMLELGIGLEPNMAKASILYAAAAEAKSTKALNRLGLMHFNGEGVLQDYEKAAGYICEAASLGDMDAQFNCAGLQADGKGVGKDTGEALRWYQKAADQGHIGALNALGFIYLRGAQDIKADSEQAMSYFEHSAARGNPVGLFELAKSYEEGQIIAKDLAKAHLYYNLAAARQHPAAPNALKRITAQLSNEQIKAAQHAAKQWRPVTDQQ